MHIFTRATMLVPIILYTCFYLFGPTSGSILTAPPLSAVIVAFESVHDISLLANTLSDQGIDTMLIIPTYAANELHNNLIDVEVLQLNVHNDTSAYNTALEACNSLLRDQKVLKRVQELQPTFTIFPGLRHDGCLLPWARHIESNPVIWTGNAEEEAYAFESTELAVSLPNGTIWNRFWMKSHEYFVFFVVQFNYHSHVLHLVAKYLPNVSTSMKDYYSDVRLLLWGADPVLRCNFASLTQLIVEIGCHHCRGSHPLSKNLQKSMVEHRQGTIVVLLDGNYETLVTELATKLPQGREGQAVLWRINKTDMDIALPENLFIHGDIDRQDLIGYSRTRVMLSHCTDTEFLEAAFHGTPMICLPRNTYESSNSKRAVELGFAYAVEDHVTAEEIAKTVQTIHETAAYRENARKVSIALRDRLNPASDRLIFWLRYIARTKNSDSRRFLRPNNYPWTLAEQKGLILLGGGMLFGTLFGMLIAGVVTVKMKRFFDMLDQEQRPTKRHMP